MELRLLNEWTGRPVFELTPFIPSLQRSVALGGPLTKIQRALEAEGIIFIEDGTISTEGGPGVGLR